MKSQAFSHLKTKRLRRHLKIPHFAAVGLLESLWQVVQEYSPQGRLSDIDPDDLAEELGWEESPSDLIDALVHTGWVDRVGDELLVHDWSEHCPNFIHRRLYRNVEYFADGSMPKRSPCDAKEREDADPKWAALANDSRRDHEQTMSGSRVDRAPVANEPCTENGNAEGGSDGVTSRKQQGYKRSDREQTVNGSRSDHELVTQPNPTQTNTTTNSTQGDAGGGGSGRSQVSLRELTRNWEAAKQLALEQVAAGDPRDVRPDLVQALASWTLEQPDLRNPMGLFLSRLKAQEWPPDEFVVRWREERRSAKAVKATIDRVYEEANS